MALSEAIAPNLSRWVGRPWVAQTLLKSPRLRRALENSILKNSNTVYKTRIQEEEDESGREEEKQELQSLYLWIADQGILPRVDSYHDTSKPYFKVIAGGLLQ